MTIPQISHYSFSCWKSGLRLLCVRHGFYHWILVWGNALEESINLSNRRCQLTSIFMKTLFCLLRQFAFLNYCFINIWHSLSSILWESLDLHDSNERSSLGNNSIWRKIGVGSSKRWHWKYHKYEPLVPSLWFWADLSNQSPMCEVYIFCLILSELKKYYSSEDKLPIKFNLIFKQVLFGKFPQTTCENYILLGLFILISWVSYLLLLSQWNISNRSCLF